MDEEISSFQFFSTSKIQLWLNRLPANHDGLLYFETHFFDLFDELKQEGQRILDNFKNQITREERSTFSRKLEEIIALSLSAFKKGLTKM